MKSVNQYLVKNNQWKEELFQLRNLALSRKLTETYKWSFPVYTLGGKNIIGLGAFKSYTGIWFFQGGLLKDSAKVLTNAQEGKTQAMRQWRFHSSAEIRQNEALILAYIDDAIANHKAGRAIKATKRKPLVIPSELQNVLDKDQKLNQAFEGLNLTRKRDFAEYIQTAKREETKKKRLDKIIPMIFEGIGLNDKYK